MIPTLVVPRGTAHLGGTADDPSWAKAASTGPFVNSTTGRPAPAFPMQGSAQALWDEENMYVRFRIVEERDAGKSMELGPTGFTAAGQPKLWTASTTELMIEPGPEGTNAGYHEIQIDSANRIFKSRFDSFRQPSGGPNGPFGHEDWSPPLRRAVAVSSSLIDDAKEQVSFTVDIAIPWTAFEPRHAFPPKSGDVWRMNFYAVWRNSAVAWSPILEEGNFHKASRWGKVLWDEG